MQKTTVKKDRSYIDETTIIQEFLEMVANNNEGSAIELKQDHTKLKQEFEGAFIDAIMLAEPKGVYAVDEDELIKIDAILQMVEV